MLAASAYNREPSTGVSLCECCMAVSGRVLLIK